jgi:hypothetical protein
MTSPVPLSATATANTRATCCQIECQAQNRASLASGWISRARHGAAWATPQSTEPPAMLFFAASLAQSARSVYGILRISALRAKHTGTAMSTASAHLSSGYQVMPRASQARVAITGAWMRYAV